MKKLNGRNPQQAPPVLALVTLLLIIGVVASAPLTLTKYVTTGTITVSARVAKWDVRYVAGGSHLPFGAINGNVYFQTDLDAEAGTSGWKVQVQNDSEVTARVRPVAELEAGYADGGWITFTTSSVMPTYDANAAAVTWNDPPLTTKEVYVRDPFVMYHKGMYFMFGTGIGANYSFRLSSDLQTWSNPRTVWNPWNDPGLCYRLEVATGSYESYWNVANPKTKDYWAPEITRMTLGGREMFFMTVSYKVNEGGSSYTQTSSAILASFAPEGPFRVIANAGNTNYGFLKTNPTYECLDGTLFVDGSDIWYVWSENGNPSSPGFNSTLKAQKITFAPPVSDNIDAYATSNPVTLVGSELTLLTKMDGATLGPLTGWLAEGPFFYRTTGGELILLVTGYQQEQQYCVLQLRSSTGTMDGSWAPVDNGLYKRDDHRFLDDGGHCMVFEDGAGNLILCLHSENEWPWKGAFHAEHATFFLLQDDGSKLVNLGGLPSVSFGKATTTTPGKFTDNKDGTYTLVCGGGDLTVPFRVDAGAPAFPYREVRIKKLYFESVQVD